MRCAPLRHVLIVALVTGSLGAALLAAGLGTAGDGRAAAAPEAGRAMIAGVVPAQDPARLSSRTADINKPS